MLSRRTLQVLEGHTRPVLSLAWSATHLFSGSYDHTIRVWDLNTLQRVTILSGARRLPSACRSRAIRCFHGSFGRGLRTERGAIHTEEHLFSFGKQATRTPFAP